MTATPADLQFALINRPQPVSLRFIDQHARSPRFPGGQTMALVQHSFESGFAQPELRAAQCSMSIKNGVIASFMGGMAIIGGSGCDIAPEPFKPNCENVPGGSKIEWQVPVAPGITDEGSELRPGIDCDDAPVPGFSR